MNLRLIRVAFLGANLFMAPAALAATTVLNPEADTYIDFVDNPISTHGSESTISVARFSIFSDSLSLLRFDLSGIPNGSTVSSATLTLTTASAPTGSDDLLVYTITSPWSEGTASGDSPPGIGFITVDLASVTPATTTVIFDITSLVSDWVDGSTDNNGLAIDNSFSPNFFAAFHSREGTTPPELSVTYAPIPEPSSVAFLLAATGLIGIRRRKF